MNTTNGQTNGVTKEQRTLLERRAEVARGRLLRAIDALGARRRRVRTIGTQAKRLAIPLALSVGVVAALAGGGVLALGYAIRRRRERPLSTKMIEAVQARLVPRPSLAFSMLQRVSLTVVTIVSSEVARRTVKNFFDGRLPDGRLAAAGALEAHHQELTR